ncbi:MAG: MBL fold metallo-hydrolase [Vicinamibacterales bacterium]
MHRAGLARRWLVLAVLVAGGVTAIYAAAPPQTSSSSDRPPGSVYTGPAFRFNKVAEGVYHAVGTGALAVFCNASIIVNENEAIVIDTHTTPAGAWALREELKAITPKPVRYVINTHWHFDHSHGNQIYGPNVDIIGSAFTRQMIAGGHSMKGRGIERFIGSIPSQIDQLEARLGASTDPAERAKLQAALDVQKNHLEATKAVVPTPPNVTLTDQLVLHRGAREIRLMFLGRGHTGGDVVVYLPEERLVMTGDLLVEGTSYMGDAYAADWIETLDRLKALEFDRVLPGHGSVLEGKARIDHWQAYLRDFWTEVQALHRAKVPADEAAKRIDMRAHAHNYPAITAPGVIPDNVHRAYELMDGKAQ